VLKIDPNFVPGYCNRGIAYIGKKNYVGAMADFEKAIQIDPDCAGAYTGRGNVYGEQKNYGFGDSGL
jgi:Tfp pilus assembly protein PilF